MDYKEVMKQILNEQKEIALATSVNNKSSVRILVFCCDTDKEGVLYFTTFPDSEKVKEFEANDTVSFTTIPYDDSKHVRVYEGKVIKSDYSVYDLAPQFCEKKAEYAGMIEEAGDVLVVYEVHFSEVVVAASYTESALVSL